MFIARETDREVEIWREGVETRVYAAMPSGSRQLVVFEQVCVAPAEVDRLLRSERPPARLAGELLAVRRSHLIGDAGALVLLTHPDLFTVEQRRIDFVGAHLTEAANGCLVDVVVDVDAEAVARTYVEVLLGA